MRSLPEKTIHRVFEVSITLKGVHALLEVVGGILLYTVSVGSIDSFLTLLSSAELLEDPHDIISNFLITTAQSLSVSSKAFAAFYLLSHGAIKVVLVAGLLRNKYWAYPTSLVVLGLFILYQAYRYTFTHSVWLVALTIFDLVVMWLIWHEYKLVRVHKP